MEPNREGGPNFELNLPPAPEGGQRQERAAEAPAARPETAGKQAPAPALPVIPDDIPSVDQPVIAAPPQDLAAPVIADPKAAAQDGDRIEKEWVDKAKAVIAHTQDDPYRQKDQMSRIKAEYIQKRFNKTIKTDEAPA
jgi:hypothetical protein